MPRSLQVPPKSKHDSEYNGSAALLKYTGIV